MVSSAEQVGALLREKGLIFCRGEGSQISRVLAKSGLAGSSCIDRKAETGSILKSAWQEEALMESRTNDHSIREFVDSLQPGARVVWIANGTLGTVQPDHTILWDNGHHMTHSQMHDAHALIIHKAPEKKHLQGAATKVPVSKKNDGTLLHLNARGGKKSAPEEVYPLAIVPEPEIPSAVGRRRHHMKSARAGARHALAS
jgi:hypothetical protein